MIRPKPGDSRGSGGTPASRIRELTKGYEKRRAAEVMSEIPVTASTLAYEGVQVMKKRNRELEEENKKLKDRVAELEEQVFQLESSADKCW